MADTDVMEDKIDTLETKVSGLEVKLSMLDAEGNCESGIKSLAYLLGRMEDKDRRIAELEAAIDASRETFDDMFVSYPDRSGHMTRLFEEIHPPTTDYGGTWLERNPCPYVNHEAGEKDGNNVD